MDQHFILAVASGALANLTSWLVQRRVEGRQRPSDTASPDVPNEPLPSTGGGGMWIGNVRQHGDSNVISGPGSRIHIDRRQHHPQRGGEKSADDDLSNMIAMAVIGFVVVAIVLALVSTYLFAIIHVVIGAVAGLALRATAVTLLHRRHLRPASAVSHLTTLGLGCAAVVAGLMLASSADRGGMTLRSYSRLVADAAGTDGFTGYVARSVEVWSSIDSSVRPHLVLQLLGLLLCVLLALLAWSHHLQFAHQLRGRTQDGGKLAVSTVALTLVAAGALGMSSGAVFDVYSTHSASLVPVAGTPSDDTP